MMDEVVPAAPETKPSASVQVSSSGHNFRPKFFTIAITHRQDAVYRRILTSFRRWRIFASAARA